MMIYTSTDPPRNMTQCKKQNRTYWFSQNLGLAAFMFCVHPTDMCSTYHASVYFTVTVHRDVVVQDDK